MLSVDSGIELGLTVFVTSRRYRQTNSAQALKLGLGLGLGLGPDPDPDPDPDHRGRRCRSRAQARGNESPAFREHGLRGTDTCDMGLGAQTHVNETAMVAPWSQCPSQESVPIPREVPTLGKPRRAIAVEKCQH